MHNFKNNLSVRRMSAAVSGGTSDVNGASLDLQDLHNPTCVEANVAFGTITNNAVTSIKWQGSHDNSAWTDLAATGQTVEDDDDNMIFRNEISPGPDHRYVRAVIDRGTANAIIIYAWYLVGHYRTAGERNDSHVADHRLTVFPQEGTA